MRYYYTVMALSCSLSAAELSLDPTLHLNGVAGITSADSPSLLAGHEHDPNNNFALQGLDIGLNFKADDWLQAFANINVFTTEDHELEAEWEEGFIKFPELPVGFELRAGRYLNRFGLQNNLHLHSWDFVNSNLSTSQFLGEEGLTTEGVELSWFRDFDQSLIALTGSYGKAAGHGHEEEEEEEGDSHGHGETLENAYFADDLVTARILFGFNNTDFHQHRFGLNGGWGQNGFGNDRDTSLYSFDYTYTWRENGLEKGGREFSVALEYFYRDVDWEHPENAATRGTSSQSGFMASALYRFADQWIAGLRYEHIEGTLAGPEIDMGVIEYAFETEKRDRISLALTREFTISDFQSHARLQYDHDELDTGSEDSIWFQFGFNFGEGEIR